MATKNPISIAKSLSGIDFPAKKKDLEKHASEHGADDQTLEAIRELPEDSFDNMADVMKAFGEEYR